MSAVGGVRAPHIGGGDEEDVARRARRANNQVDHLLAEVAHGIFSIPSGRLDHGAIQAGGPIRDLDGEVGDGELAGERLGRNDAAGHVVDEEPIHGGAGVARAGNDVDDLTLAGRPTGVERAEHGEHGLVGTGLAALLLLVPFSPP